MTSTSSVRTCPGALEHKVVESYKSYVTVCSTDKWRTASWVDEVVKGMSVTYSNSIAQCLVKALKVYLASLTTGLSATATLTRFYRFNIDFFLLSMCLL